MEDMYYWGMLIGILAVAVILSVVFLVRRKAGKGKEKRFDERQMIARGQAYQVGFFTMLGYFFLYGIMDGLGLVWCETFMGCFVGVMLGAAAFALTAIRKDAYLALNENMKTFCWVGGLFIVANLLGTIADIMEGKLIVDGKLTTAAADSLVMTLWLVILVAQLIHYRKLKKQEKADEEE